MPEKKRYDPGLRQTLLAFDQIFSEKLPERLSELALVLQQCQEQPADRSHHMAALHRLLHTMAGTAGTFGYAELGKQARQIDQELNALLTAGSTGEQEFAPIAQAMTDLLRGAAVQGDASQTPSQPQTAVYCGPDGLSPRLIYLVEGDQALAADIGAQLENFGYEVVTIGELHQLEGAIRKLMPSAIVMDLGFGGETRSGAAELARIRQSIDYLCPVVFIALYGNFTARLAAVHAGAEGYFVVPVDVPGLIERLDALTLRREISPYRILIVEDDLVVAGYYGAVLRGAGMDVRILDELSEILQVLGKYRPELILMDIYMPNCSGLDLATLIRQDKMYLDVPIIFLSSEDNVGKQLDAIQCGADDFLNKPIEPAHLISSLSSRAERYRSLRGLIMRDGLTGLYNHSAIKEHLMREISRARRSKTALALAMIDLDFFKRINDTYGHPVGDQVIRTLSRLLQQRLRHGDVIGRYGGEEFAVLLPTTAASVAKGVLDQVREAFSKIRHHADEGEFTATFSVGVADLDALPDADALFRAADAALYRAKHNGRNRIELALGH